MSLHQLPRCYGIVSGSSCQVPTGKPQLRTCNQSHVVKGADLAQGSNTENPPQRSEYSFQGGYASTSQPKSKKKTNTFRGGYATGPKDAPAQRPIQKRYEQSELGNYRGNGQNYRQGLARSQVRKRGIQQDPSQVREGDFAGQQQAREQGTIWRDQQRMRPGEGVGNEQWNLPGAGESGEQQFINTGEGPGQYPASTADTGLGGKIDSLAGASFQDIGDSWNSAGFRPSASPPRPSRSNYQSNEKLGSRQQRREPENEVTRINNLYDYPQLYDYAMSYRDIDSECDFLYDVYEKHCLREPKSCVEIGCGPAQHSMEMAQSGLTAYGVDLNKKMLTYGEQLAEMDGVEDLKLLHGDMRNFQLDKQVDLAFCLCGTLNELETNWDAVACLASANEALRTGGILVIELPHPQILFDGQMLAEGESWKAEFDKGQVKAWWGDKDNYFNAKTQVLERLIKIDFISYEDGFLPKGLVGPCVRVKQRHNERFYTYQEMEMFAWLTQFEIVGQYTDMDIASKFQAVRGSGRRLVLVLKKIQAVARENFDFEIPPFETVIYRDLSLPKDRQPRRQPIHSDGQAALLEQGSLNDPEASRVHGIENGTGNSSDETAKELNSDRQDQGDDASPVNPPTPASWSVASAGKEVKTVTQQASEQQSTVWEPSSSKEQGPKSHSIATGGLDIDDDDEADGILLVDEEEEQPLNSRPVNSRYGLKGYEEEVEDDDGDEVEAKGEGEVEEEAEGIPSYEQLLQEAQQRNPISSSSSKMDSPVVGSIGEQRLTQTSRSNSSGSSSKSNQNQQATNGNLSSNQVLPTGASAASNQTDAEQSGQGGASSQPIDYLDLLDDPKVAELVDRAMLPELAGNLQARDAAMKELYDLYDLDMDESPADGELAGDGLDAVSGQGKGKQRKPKVKAGGKGKRGKQQRVLGDDDDDEFGEEEAQEDQYEEEIVRSTRGLILEWKTGERQQQQESRFYDDQEFPWQQSDGQQQGSQDGQHQQHQGSQDGQHQGRQEQKPPQ